MVQKHVNAQDAVIPAYLQRVLFRNLEQQGIKQEVLLEGLPFSSEQFKDDDFRMTFEQHKLFVQNAITAVDDPHLGWRFGQQVNVTSLGMLGYAIMASTNVASAITTLAQFLRLRAPSYDLRLVGDGSDSSSAILIIDESFDFEEVRYFMLSSIISGIDHIFSFLTQAPSLITLAEMTCDEPTGWRSQTQHIPFPVIFNAPGTRLHLDSALLDNAIPTADPDSEETTKQICQQMLSSFEHQSGIVKEVNELILKSAGGYPSLTEAANELCMSPRTLRRELQKSNTTYQQLLDSVRARVARELLLNTPKTIAEVAFDVGYKDASNFNRAFKSWTGVSPGELRKR